MRMRCDTYKTNNMIKKKGLLELITKVKIIQKELNLLWLNSLIISYNIVK